MRLAVRRLAVMTPIALLGCGLWQRPAPAPPANPRYVVGPAYQSGIAWFYPREDFHLDTTGLAVVSADRPGLTANGEARDATAMAGAHATLQLPAIVRVTNLETGLQALIRINDRGPSAMGRLLGLSRRAADRLGMARDGVARVRVQVEDEPSQALRALLQKPALSLSTVPRGIVAAETLTPPPGFEPSRRTRTVAAARPATEAVDAPAIVAARLPDTAIQVPAIRSQLWLQMGEFGQIGYAQQVRLRSGAAGAMVQRIGQGRSEVFRVRAGPFADVVRADSALDQAMQAGVTDAHIIVE